MRSATPIYVVLASLVQSVKNCQKSSNAEWELVHKMNAEQVVRDFLPSGSGWDVGTTLAWTESQPDRIILFGSYHHMDSGGSYSGWTDHSVIVTPSLGFGFNLRITGRDRDGIKEYLHETFDYALRQEIKQIASERGPKGFAWVKAVPLVKQIQDALGTGETDDGLVSVARNAHAAEQTMAGIEHTAISGLDGNPKAALQDILEYVRRVPHVVVAREVQQRTEDTVLKGYIDNLRRAIQMHPNYVSGDDSLLSAQDVVHTARMVLERMKDAGRAVSLDALKEIARNLKSEDGENPEYDRALVEVVADASGLSQDDKPDVAKELGIDLNAGSTYAIYWYEENVRKEAHYTAATLNEALTKFLVEHPKVSYDQIVEHLEVA